VIELVRTGYERLTAFIQRGLEYFGWLATERAEVSETTDLAGVVRRVADHLPGLTEPGVDFQLSAIGVPCFVRGEEKHLAEVVRALLDNALKFSPREKSIRVDVHMTAETVILAVADCGRGFAPELAKELFRPFTIADVKHQSQGTGLNLALASAIVEAYGGHIRAESTGIGQGATFTVEFPVVACET
jgi:signal transduction histidine kinase